MNVQIWLDNKSKMFKCGSSLNQVNKQCSRLRLSKSSKTWEHGLALALLVKLSLSQISCSNSSSILSSWSWDLTQVCYQAHIKHIIKSIWFGWVVLTLNSQCLINSRLSEIVVYFLSPYQVYINPRLDMFYWTLLFTTCLWSIFLLELSLFIKQV